MTVASFSTLIHQLEPKRVVVFRCCWWWCSLNWFINVLTSKSRESKSFWGYEMMAACAVRLDRSKNYFSFFMYALRSCSVVWVAEKSTSDFSPKTKIRIKPEINLSVWRTQRAEHHISILDDDNKRDWKNATSAPFRSFHRLLCCWVAGDSAMKMKLKQKQKQNRNDRNTQTPNKRRQLSRGI